MKIVKITDDSGFLGIANFHKYKSFIGEDWDFELIKTHLINEMNANHLLFWSTGLENTYKVALTNTASSKESYREIKGIIEVTNRKLFLTNYESLTIAAQFKAIKLPELHCKDLFIELTNGKYRLTIRQMYHPNAYDFDSSNEDFEIVIQKITRLPEIYVNKIEDILWLNGDVSLTHKMS